jgi:hypothetical protein
VRHQSGILRPDNENFRIGYCGRPDLESNHLRGDSAIGSVGLLKFLDRMKPGPRSSQSQRAGGSLYHGHGGVVRVPIEKCDGSVSFERHFYYMVSVDQGWLGVVQLDRHRSGSSIRPGADIHEAPD